MDIKVNWDNQSNMWWHETCAIIAEHFGLPGDRYTSHPTEDNMVFKFYDDRDATMCRLLISERL
jgi:hypothetical protein